MSHAAALSYPDRPRSIRRSLFVRVAILLTASVTICATVIIRYTDWQAGSLMAEFSTLVEVGVNTLLPYMISAVVAAITAVAIMAILPAARTVNPSAVIVERLRELTDGNLASKVTLQADGNLREISYELNRAVTTLNGQVSKLKVINRQQWQTLCEIRAAVELQDYVAALKQIDDLEQNWTRIAEIEKSLAT